MSDETTDASPDEPTEPSDAAAGSSTAGSSTPGSSAAGERKVVRRTVTSRRVTPKGGAKVEATSKARDAKKTEAVVNRAANDPDVQPTYPKGPSPAWVPALMFGLLIVGALVIMLNYAEVFGEPDNIRLVAGLGLILGGIITATQYR